MLTLPANVLSDLSGSTSNSRLQFNIWYDNTMVAKDIPVKDYKIDFDISRSIVGSTTVNVIDNVGNLTPWAISDTLGVGGACLQTMLVHRGLFIPLGFQPIGANDVTERWSLVGPNRQWSFNSADIAVQAQDLTLTLQGAGFMTQETVAAGGTCLSEIKRLTTGYMDVSVDPAVVDANVPAAVVYQQDRLGAVMNLVGVLGAEARSGPSGQLEIYMPSTTSVWEINGDFDGGDLISFKRSQRIQDFPNAAVSTANDANGLPLFGYAVQSSGDGYFDGPHKRWVVYHGANLVNTQASVSADASTTLANMIRTRTVEIPFRVGFHPGLQVGDWVTIDMPILDGTYRQIVGRVRTISYAGTLAVPTGMDITVQVPAASAKSLSDAMRTALRQRSI